MTKPEPLAPKQAHSSHQADSLKEFFHFLHTSCLQAVVEENLALIRAHKLPILQLFDHLSEEELLLLLRQSLEEFFREFAEDRALEQSLLKIEKWKANEMPGIKAREVKITDIVMSHSIRKRLFMQFLPRYSQDVEINIAICLQLEDFYSRLEHHAFEAYTDIQQEALHQKNTFLSSLIHFSTHSILALDTELKVVEWNEQMEALTRLPRAEVLGLPIAQLFPKAEQYGYLAKVKKALAGETLSLKRQAYSFRRGWFDASFVPLRNEQEEINGLLIIIQDISERVVQEENLKEHQEELQAANEELTEQREEIQAANEELQESMTRLEETQEALQESLQKLEEALSMARLGSWEYDLHKNQIQWSKELWTIFGLDPKTTSLSYEVYLAHIHPDDLALVTNAVAECVEKKQPYKFEHRICRPDGKVRWILGTGYPVRDEHGQITHLRGTSLDVTSQKLAEMRIREEQLFIKKITDNTPDIISVFDLDKRCFVFENRSLTESLGYTAEESRKFELNGLGSYTALLHPEDLLRMHALSEAFKQQSDNESQEIEYRIRNKAGQYVWLHTRYTVFKRSKQGRPQHIIGLSRDVNARKQAEEKIRQSELNLRRLNEQLEEKVNKRTFELQKNNEQLSRINADLDTFIYTASHDLRVPIANLEGLLNLLSSKIESHLGERDRDLLQMMHTSVQRFRKTILELTDVSRIQKELEEEEREKLNIRRMLDDVLADLQTEIKKSKVVFCLELEAEDLYYDARNLRSILYNLISNAIKYRHPDRQPKVSIRTQNREPFVWLQITDNGLGIAEKHHQKIFSLFKRLHRESDGSGVGLYLVKRMVENSGGRIEVESRENNGTTFHVYLHNQTV